jgi:hypothetical protein
MDKSHERIQAERELVAFLQQYCALISTHITSIRALMASTTEKVMESVMQISDAKDHRRRLADAKLVKRRDGEGIERAIQGDDATFKIAEFSKEDGDFSNKTTVALLKAQMGGFDALDSEVQEVLFGIVGSLSADDVVGQRLSHVISGLQNLEMSMLRMLDTSGSLIPEKELATVFAEILAATKKSYTMPEEHEALARVFG